MVSPATINASDCALCGEFVAEPNYLIFKDRLVCQDCVVAFCDEVFWLDRLYWDGLRRDRRRVRGKPKARFSLVAR